MGKAPAVRVAVVASDGRSSGTWRIWVGREDIYVSPRSDASVYKVSLHPYGWRWAYSEAHPRGPGDFLPEGHDRCLFRFQKPPFDRGVQFAFAIGITPDGLMHHPADQPVTVLPAPAGDAWIKVLRIYITEPGRTQADLGLNRFEVVPPSPLRLESGRSVWIVATEEEGPPAPDAALGPPVASFVRFVDYDPKDFAAPGLIQVGVRLSDEGGTSTMPAAH